MEGETMSDSPRTINSRASEVNPLALRPKDAAKPLGINERKLEEIAKSALGDAMSDRRDIALALADHEAAALLGCSRSHFRNLHRQGMIPAPVRLGRSTKWRCNELVDWLNAGCPPLHRWHWKGD